jgi:hypothetical protein
LGPLASYTLSNWASKNSTVVSNRVSLDHLLHAPTAVAPCLTLYSHGRLHCTTSSTAVSAASTDATAGRLAQALFSSTIQASSSNRSQTCKAGIRQAHRRSTIVLLRSLERSGLHKTIVAQTSEPLADKRSNLNPCAALSHSSKICDFLLFRSSYHIRR